MASSERNPSLRNTEALTQHLRSGVEAFVTTHFEIQGNRQRKPKTREEREKVEKTKSFIKKSALGIVEERNARGIESNSAEVKEAIEIIRDLLPFPAYGVFCVDERIKRLGVYGLPPGVISESGIGGFMHVPAGEIPDLRQGRGQELILPKASYFGELIERQVEKHGRIVELRDAHQGCAAKKLSETRKGTLQVDGGLYASVERIIKEAKATDAFAEGKVLSIITSFDPQTNGLIMGLERQEILEAGKKNGYTPDFLREQAEQNKIIDTNFLRKERLLDQFLDNYKISNFDWDNNYSSTLVQFWRNIKQMKEDGLVGSMEELVRYVYNKSEFPKEHLSEEEVQERAVLLMANAYSGHLLHRKHQAHQRKAAWEELENPNASHTARIFCITDEDDGPYKNFPDFSVFSRDLGNLARRVDLTRDIIGESMTRNDRPIVDITDTFLTPQAYAAAPKIGIAKEVIRADLAWDKVQKINWSNMPDNWVTLSSEDFRNYIIKQCRSVGLHEKFDDFEKFFKGIDHLREIMVVLNTETTTRQSLEDGSLVVMPMLFNDRREVVAIPQFIEKGFQEERIVYSTN